MAQFEKKRKKKYKRDFYQQYFILLLTLRLSSKNKLELILKTCIVHHLASVRDLSTVHADFPSKNQWAADHCHE